MPKFFVMEHDTARRVVQRQPSQSQQGRASPPMAGGLPARDMPSLLLHLQRTVGNAAVNGLLQRQAVGMATHIQRAPETESGQPAPAADQPHHSAAAVMWQDGVVERLTSAQEAVKQGHYAEAESVVTGTYTAINALEEVFANNPLAKGRVTEFETQVQLVGDDLLVFDHGSYKGAGQQFMADCGVAWGRAKEIGPSLDATVKGQSGTTGPAPNPAPALWQALVVEGFQQMLNAFFEDPDANFDRALGKHGSVFLTDLTKIREIIKDNAFANTGDEVSGLGFATLMHTVDSLIALATPAAHKKIDVAQISARLDRAAHRAEFIGQLLGAGTVDQPTPAPTPAPEATPAPSGAP